MRTPKGSIASSRCSSGFPLDFGILKPISRRSRSPASHYGLFCSTLNSVDPVRTVSEIDEDVLNDRSLPLPHLPWQLILPAFQELSERIATNGDVSLLFERHLDSLDAITRIGLDDCTDVLPDVCILLFESFLRIITAVVCCLADTEEYTDTIDTERSCFDCCACPLD
jgi:hypothetical protein